MAAMCNPSHLLALLATLCAATPHLTAADETPAEPRDERGEVRVLLQDGKTVQGTLLRRDEAGVVLDVAGTPVRIPATAVRDVVAVSPGGDSRAVRDPNRTRYLYSPSAFMLRRGEGYVSQAELVLTTVAVGATDWLPVQAGTVLPVVFYDPTVLPFALAAKAGASPSELLHLAVGLQTLVIPGVSEAPAVGFLFATATFGSEDRHVSVSAGPPFLLEKGTSDLGAVLVTVSGALRVAPRIALVTENWIVPIDGAARFGGSGAIRFIADRLGVDAGLVFPQGSAIPIPWLDFTWHWR
jgi:hypothetical protein